MEVVTLCTILLTNLDNVSVGDLWRDVHCVILNLTGEDLVWVSVELTYECNPHLRAVLEADDIRWDRLRTTILACCLLALLWFSLLALLVNQDTCTATVTIYGDTLTARLPSGAIYIGNNLLRDVVWKIYGNRNRVVNPLLNCALHLNLSNPIDIVCGSLVVWRCCNPLLQLLIADSVEARDVVAIDAQPIYELVVIYIVLLEYLSLLVCKCRDNLVIAVRRVNLATTLIYRAEHRLDTRSCLRHQRCGTCWSNCKHCDVTTTILNHLLIERCIGIFQTVNHWVVLLLLGVEYGERTTHTSHIYRLAVSLYGQGLVYLCSEVESLVRAVAQTECCQHIALGSDTETCTTTLQCHILNLVPQVELYTANILILRIRSNLLDDEVNLLQLQVDNIIHQVHSLVNMLLEEVEVERSLLRKWIFNIRVEVDSQQTAAVVRAQRNLATRVGRNGYEALVSVAVRHTLTDDSIPEQYTRLCRLPRIVDNLAPQLRCVDILHNLWLIGVDRELLGVCATLDSCTHKLVVNLYRHICSCHLVGVELCIDELLRVGVLDRDREHQRSTTTILRNLTSRVRVTLHKWNDTCRGECRVQYRASRRADVREVMTYATTTLH